MPNRLTRAALAVIMPAVRRADSFAFASRAGLGA